MSEQQQLGQQTRVDWKLYSLHCLLAPCDPSHLQNTVLLLHLSPFLPTHSSAFSSFKNVLLINPSFAPFLCPALSLSLSVSLSHYHSRSNPKPVTTLKSLSIEIISSKQYLPKFQKMAPLVYFSLRKVQLLYLVLLLFTSVFLCACSEENRSKE